MRSTISLFGTIAALVLIGYLAAPVWEAAVRSILHATFQARAHPRPLTRACSYLIDCRDQAMNACWSEARAEEPRARAAEYSEGMRMLSGPVTQ
ncbi:MAG TPA: hypothetical protein VMU31_00005, partial [Rhizomicrobium sp.]|nr:hypothetical protein [Rhizomicrobium sp.]